MYCKYCVCFSFFFLVCSQAQLLSCVEMRIATKIFLARGNFVSMAKQISGMLKCSWSCPIELAFFCVWSQIPQTHTRYRAGKELLWYLWFGFVQLTPAISCSIAFNFSDQLATYKPIDFISLLFFCMPGFQLIFILGFEFSLLFLYRHSWIRTGYNI